MTTQTQHRYLAALLADLQKLVAEKRIVYKDFQKRPRHKSANNNALHHRAVVRETHNLLRVLVPLERDLRKALAQPSLTLARNNFALAPYRLAAALYAQFISAWTVPAVDDNVWKFKFDAGHLREYLLGTTADFRQNFVAGPVISKDELALMKALTGKTLGELRAARLVLQKEQVEARSAQLADVLDKLKGTIPEADYNLLLEHVRTS